MLSLFRRAFCLHCFPWGTGPTCEDHLSHVEKWSMRHAGKASPDDIIAAAIIESFAKDFDDWKGSCPEGIAAKERVCNEGDIRDSGATLVNRKKKITIATKWVKGRSREGDGLNPWHYSCSGMCVNDVPLDAINARRIIQAHDRLKFRVEAAKEAARKAKADMERNEAAWNIAENLLGMKRNEHGALVPIQAVEA